VIGRLAVVGLGLLGGSVAKGARAQGLEELDQELIVPARFVNGQAAAGANRESIVGPEAEQPRVLPEEDAA